MINKFFCQCLDEISGPREHCSTYGCPRAKDPPSSYSGRLIAYNDGLVRPSTFSYAA